MYKKNILSLLHKITMCSKWTLLFCIQNVHFADVILYTEWTFCRCYFVYKMFICRCYFLYRVNFLPLLQNIHSVLFDVVNLCTHCAFCRCYFVYKMFILSLLQNEHSVHKITTAKRTLCTQNNNGKKNTLYKK